MSHIENIRKIVSSTGAVCFKFRNTPTKTKGTKVVLERLRLNAETQKAIKEYAAKNATSITPFTIGKLPDGTWGVKNLTMYFS